MITIQTACLSLDAIYDSGQCFRWTPREGGYRIAARDKILRACQARDSILLYCSPEEYESIWKAYFDIDTDYPSIIRAIPENDSYLQAAAAYGQGIRILRQDPWETLITFILSQRKNIPAIRQAVEKLCAAAGRIIGEDQGEPMYSFPSPEEILCLRMDELRACGLGYRAEYVRRTAEAWRREGFSAESFSQLSDEALLAALRGFYGVGKKIALCTMLFGFHRMNAFPIDVWMQRVGARYPNGIPTEAYAPWGGVMQQYMFAYERYLAAEEKSRP